MVNIYFEVWTSAYGYNAPLSLDSITDAILLKNNLSLKKDEMNLKFLDGALLSIQIIRKE